MIKLKKVVVLGGGTGLSTLLRGLKQFPIDITAIVTVSDDGRSTGKLRQEFNVPAVGDIRQVIVALSETEPLVQKLLNYRFKTNSDLNGHALGNLLLTAYNPFIAAPKNHEIIVLSDTLTIHQLTPLGTRGIE